MLRQPSNLSSSRRWLTSLAVSALSLSPMSVLGQAAMIDVAPAISDLTNSIEVFTTAGMPMSNVPDDVAVIELDAPARLDAEISQGLPKDSAAAKDVMLERMHSPEWEHVVMRYGDLYTGVARAWLLRVEKLPAVVVDGQFVVYGQPDVTAAVMDIMSQRESRDDE